MPVCKPTWKLEFKTTNSLKKHLSIFSHIYRPVLKMNSDDNIVKPHMQIFQQTLIKQRII